MVHTQLHHGHRVVRTQVQQRQGHTNVVVQIALGGQAVLRLGHPQDAGQHLGHGGFAIAAGHGNQGQLKLRTPTCGQLTQGQTCVWHHHSGHANSLCVGAARGLAQDGDRPHVFGLGNELRAIKTLTAQGHKQITGAQGARVGMHTLHVHCAFAMQHGPLQPRQQRMK